MDVKNGAVVITRESKLPFIAAFLSAPVINDSISLEIGDYKMVLHIVDYPVRHDEMEWIRRRKNRIFEKLCRSYDMQAVLWTGVKPEGKSRDMVAAIKASKVVAALINLGRIHKKNLLGCSMGVMDEKPDKALISLLAENAASIMIYEASGMTAEYKEELYDYLMKEKGMSIVFTHQPENLIRQSEILFVGNSIDLGQYGAALDGKLIFGDNPTLGFYGRVSCVIAWTNETALQDEKHPVNRYNDELLTLSMLLSGEAKPMRFIRYFSSICLIDWRKQSRLIKAEY